jgi:hypothetical protein
LCIVSLASRPAPAIPGPVRRPRVVFRGMAKLNKSAFVRGLPATISAQDVVKAAAAKGIKLSDKFVHTIRYNAKVKASKGRKASTPVAAKASAPIAKRGPGRPRKLVTSGGEGTGNGLQGAIERIVEVKLNELLKAKLGSLFGG